jgi:hypothetical protein
MRPEKGRLIRNSKPLTDTEERSRCSRMNGTHASEAKMANVNCLYVRAIELSLIGKHSPLYD